MAAYAAEQENPMTQLTPHDRGILLAAEQIAQRSGYYTGGLEPERQPLVIKLDDLERLLRRAQSMVEEDM